MSLGIVILGAGQGTRMRSAMPKVLHPLAGRPMIRHLVEIAHSLTDRPPVLVVGHGLNFVLAVVGGVVHGLRLNCIEFFNWSLPDEGHPFQAFCKKASQ